MKMPTAYPTILYLMQEPPTLLTEQKSAKKKGAITHRARVESSHHSCWTLDSVTVTAR